MYRDRYFLYLSLLIRNDAAFRDWKYGRMMSDLIRRDLRIKILTWEYNIKACSVSSFEIIRTLYTRSASDGPQLIVEQIPLLNHATGILSR